jgi:hypothetical protein
MAPESPHYLSSLSIFRGGGTLEAADLVCDEEPGGFPHLSRRVVFGEGGIVGYDQAIPCALSIRAGRSHITI